MANIMEVNYQEIPGKANQIQQLGEQLNSEVTTAWNNVNDLRGTWHGTRYNVLISYFNKATDSINAILRMVIDEIPTALGTVAMNYAKADGQSVASVGAGNITAIQTLADSDTSTMAYQSSAAAAVQSQVNTNFSNAEKCMNDIETTFASITWESEAKRAFQERFSSLKAQIIDELNEINKQFTALMQASQADIEGAETANTVE